MIPYPVKEGFAGFKRATFSSVAATSAMTVALVLVGLFTIVTWRAQSVSEWLKQRVGEVEIFLEDTTPEIAASLHLRAQTMPGVEEAAFVSKEEAQAIFRSEFGEEAEVFFDEAFLPASIRVSVEPAYINTDSLNGLVAEFSSWNRVEEVLYNRPLLAKVQGNLRLLTMIGSSIGLLVLFASIFLVANTIRLAIYSRRLMIRTMKLVGATDSFVRMPFVVEGIIQGVLSAVLALFILWVLQVVMNAYVPGLVVTSFLVMMAFSGSLVVAGFLLGWIGSESAVRRFLKNISLH